MNSVDIGKSSIMIVVGASKNTDTAGSFKLQIDAGNLKGLRPLKISIATGTPQQPSDRIGSVCSKKEKRI